jgi:hypothetical protein
MDDRRKPEPAETENGDSLPETGKKSIARQLMAEIVMGIGSSLLLGFVEKRILKTRQDEDAAQPLPNQRTKTQAVAGAAATRVATRSVPGAALVGGGLLLGSLYKRGRVRKKARLQRQAQLPHTTED